MKIGKPPVSEKKLSDLDVGLLSEHKATDAQGRYLYWDKIRHKYGSLAEDVWFAVKLHRTAIQKTVSLGSYGFCYCIPDSLQAGLHFIDKTCGSHILLADGSNLSETDRNTLMMEEAITSAQLEGAATTRKVAKALLNAKKSRPKDKYERMIVNNHNLMRKVSELKNKPLDTDLILGLHRTATEGAIENQAVSGAFRQTDDIHIADAEGNPLYQPPAFAEVPQLMDALCGFANTEHDGTGGTPFIHPVAKAMMLHFFTGYIHPFGDGNGRTARALFYWFVLKNGYTLFEYISISRLLRQAPTKYGKSYLYTENDGLDMTYFLYHQANIIRRAILDMQSYVRRESAKLKDFTAKIAQFAGKHTLNRRQIEILQTAAEDKGRIFTVSDTAKQFDISENTARTDLKRLSDLGLLGLFKSGNAIHFVAPEGLGGKLG